MGLNFANDGEFWMCFEDFSVRFPTHLFTTISQECDIINCEIFSERISATRDLLPGSGHAGRVRRHRRQVGGLFDGGLVEATCQCRRMLQLPA